MFNFPDFEIFYTAAQCWLKGVDPYTCGLFYPLPTLFLFLPFTAFPLAIAKIIWFVISLTVIVIVFKQIALWYLFYVPVLQNLVLGQIDLILLPAIFFRDGIGMALLTLKPQLIVPFLPFWFWGANARQRKRFMAISALLWGLSFIAWPGWALHFSTRPIGPSFFTSPSLWGGGYLTISVIALAGAALVALSRKKWPATTAINPFIQTYDLVVLLPFARWWAVPLSWAVQMVANKIGLAFPYVFLSLSVLLNDQHPKARN